jgi:cytidylate kinase
MDGPAGSGKSTLARRLAARLGFRFLDSGAMYRALTLKALRGGRDPGDEAAMAALLSTTTVRLVDAPGGQRTLLDGDDVTDAIREPAVNAAVARVAALAKVREGMVARQREYANAAGPGCVVEGRDMGSVVFPGARVKFYLDASPEERARRRARQSGQPEGEVLASQRERDAQDRGRAVAPLKVADGAAVIDTTGLTVDEVLERLLDGVRRAGVPVGGP